MSLLIVVYGIILFFGILAAIVSSKISIVLSFFFLGLTIIHTLTAIKQLNRVMKRIEDLEIELDNEIEKTKKGE